VARLRTRGLRVPAAPVRTDPYDLPRDGRSFVVPSAWHLRAADDPVSASSLAADLDCLALVLREAYSGWESAEARGWSWADFFARWKARLSAASTLSLCEAFAPWGELLRFQLDNHSGPRLALGQQSLAQTALLEQAVADPVEAWRNAAGEEGLLDVRDAATQPRRAWAFETGHALHEVRLVCGPDWRGPLQAVRAGGRWIHARMLEGAGGPSLLAARAGPDGTERVAVSRLSPRIDVVRIPTLAYGLVDEAAGRAVESARERTAIVWDLRGNRGGTIGLVLPLLERVWPDAAAIVDVPLRTKESAAASAVQWGYAQTHLAQADARVPERMRSLLQARLDGLFAVPHPDLVWREHPGAWSLAGRTGPRPPAPGSSWHLVLVDNRCGSDGELLAAAIAARPGGVLVGTCTAGVGEFARPGHLVLPFSRVGFRIATARSDLHGDARSFDGFGVAPDVVVDGTTRWDAATLEDLLEAVRSRFSQPRTTSEAQESTAG
jgi:hypothetical protein